MFVIATEPNPRGSNGKKSVAGFVAGEPPCVLSVCMKSKLLKPFTWGPESTASLKSETNPDVDVSQNISNSDSTGAVS